jgi:transcriptional regulator with XRE-family HTH domain
VAATHRASESFVGPDSPVQEGNRKVRDGVIAADTQRIHRYFAAMHGAAIVFLRKALNVTQQTLAERAGTSERTLGKAERDERVASDTLLQIARALLTMAKGRCSAASRDPDALVTDAERLLERVQTPVRLTLAPFSEHFAGHEQAFKGQTAPELRVLPYVLPHDGDWRWWRQMLGSTNAEGWFDAPCRFGNPDWQDMNAAPPLAFSVLLACTERDKASELPGSIEKPDLPPSPTSSEAAAAKQLRARLLRAGAKSVVGPLLVVRHFARALQPTPGSRHTLTQLSLRWWPESLIAEVELRHQGRELRRHPNASSGINVEFVPGLCEWKLKLPSGVVLTEAWVEIA